MSIYGHQDLNVRNQAIELQNKVNELELGLEWAPGSLGVTVGDGGQFASLQEALDAAEGAEVNVHVLSDQTITADPVAANEETQLNMVLHNAAQLTFQNAAFFDANDFYIVTATSSGLVGENIIATPPVKGRIILEYTDAGYANTGLFDDLVSAVVSNVNVVDDSTQDGVYLMRSNATNKAETVVYLLNEPGAARTLGGVGGGGGVIMDDVAFLLEAGTTVEYLNAGGFADLKGVSSSTSSSTASAVISGGNTLVSNCSLQGTRIVISQADDMYITDCQLRNCVLEDTISTGVLDVDRLSVSGTYLSLSDDMDIRGSAIGFIGGSIDALSNDVQLTISGTSCSISGSDIANPAAKVVSVAATATGCSVVGCDLFSPAGAVFTADVVVGATDTRLIGNGFTALLTDAGTNTKNIGNTP